jgi:heme/copper-type cytochrome/quinol oxidase subunit 2
MVMSVVRAMLLAPVCVGERRRREESMNRAIRLASIAVATAAAGVLVGFYIVAFLMATPPTVSSRSSGQGQAQVTLQTVAAIGFGAHPDWVSYLVQDSQGRWVHSTILQVPAHSLVHVTIYQYDTSTGLRNPFFSQVRGTVGGVMYLNGKATKAIKADDPAHTFTIPDLGLSVPLQGISNNAKNQCQAAPCSVSQAHNTIEFTFRTGAPGSYRWQCFVPCGAGFVFGNGGPMQTMGYMDGFLKVV